MDNKSRRYDYQAQKRQFQSTDKTNIHFTDKRLQGMVQYLALLPDSALIPIIMESSSTLLSSAIHLKQCKDKLTRQQEDNSRLPKSVFENFKLQGSDLITHRDEFKDAVVEVENKIHEVRQFIKSKIMLTIK